MKPNLSENSLGIRKLSLARNRVFRNPCTSRLEHAQSAFRPKQLTQLESNKNATPTRLKSTPGKPKVMWQTERDSPIRG